MSMFNLPTITEAHPVTIVVVGEDWDDVQGIFLHYRHSGDLAPYTPTGPTVIYHAEGAAALLREGKA